MRVVRAAKVEDFLPYCSGTRLSKTMQRHVALFLAKLSNVPDAHTVKHFCIEEKGWFEQQYKNDNTRAAHMTKYRKAIAAMSADRSFPKAVTYEQETANGPVRQHIALKWMNYSSEFYQQRQAPTQAKAKAQRRQRVAFEPQPVIDAAVAALSSSSTWEVAAAIILLTGRRPTEILKSGDFTQVGAYQLEFSGQLKSRNKTTTFPIYCLERSHRLIDAFTRFRRIASVRELQEAENAAVDSRMNATVNRAVRTVFSEDILPAPLCEGQLSAKNLRAAYVNIAYHLFGTPQTSIGSFAEDFLGHQNAGSAASYEDYYCVDSKGQPLAIGLLKDELQAKPKSPRARKRTTVHVDGLLKERFEAYGEGTHKEKMAQLLDAAERNERLERQLHSLEQRLKLAKDHIALLQQKQTEQPPSAKVRAKTKKSDTPTERHRQRHKAPKESDTPTERHRQRQTSKAAKSSDLPLAPAHTPIPDDWTEMSNGELNGSQIPGSADEKVRRSIEALYEYNEGRSSSEQWSITSTVVQKLSGSNANRVKEYLERHPKVEQRLKKYNQDYGYQQNRGKGHPRESVKWPASYGAYEWSA